MTERDDAIDLTLLDPVFAGYEGQAGVLIPVLQKAQAVYGYLPVEVLQRIAERLGISVGKVYGVATFYSQFYLEKKGRHMLRVCDGTACHVKGAPALMSAVKQEFGVEPGETSEDGELTEEIVYCLGSCALAPAAVLDGKVMGRLRPEALVPRVKKSVGAAVGAGTDAEGEGGREHS
jgi:NADH-quinone oxidoreductase subunit E